MATYPSGATISTTAFSTVGTATYSSTGSTTTFAVPAIIDHVGEVVATVDGVIQDTSTYSIANAGADVSFITAPTATTLTLKVITLPVRYRTVRNFPQVRYVEYSNTLAKVISSNT